MTTDDLADDLHWRARDLAAKLLEVGDDHADVNALVCAALGDNPREACALLATAYSEGEAHTRVYQTVACAWRDVAASAGEYGD